MSERKYFVLCENNCKFEGMTKEQIMTAIERAISTGEICEDVDTGFITRIKEQNNGAGLTFWVGTSAEYNALDPKINNCFYIITDDTTTKDIEAAIVILQKTVEENRKHVDGITSFFGGEIDTIRSDINKNLQRLIAAEANIDLKGEEIREINTTIEDNKTAQAEINKSLANDIGGLLARVEALEKK